MSDTQLLQRIVELEKLLSLKEAMLKNYQAQIQLTSEKLDDIMIEMSRDIELFGKLQKILSPTELPHITGFEFSTKFIPGDKVGGDYFDLFDHADRMKFGLLLSSASGYSLSAQLLSLIIRFTAKSESRRFNEPHDMVSSILSSMQNTLKANESASLFYAMIDKRTDLMNFCSIGDVVVCIRRQGQSALEMFTSKVKAFAAGDSLNCATESFQLVPRDRIVIISGGAFQVMNSKGQSWTKDNLVSVVSKSSGQSVHELRNDILFDLEHFSGNPKFPRDLTVIVSEVKDRVLRLAKQ